MKQFTLSILLFTLFLFSCKESKENESHNDINLSCYPNNSRPLQAITYEEMVEMMFAYDKGAKKVLDKYMKKVSGGKDTISTVYNWYKLDDLKQYIAYIEKISKEKNIPVTGFRIYPSSYPKNYKVKNLQGRQTLIFTPTTLINGNKDVAFEPLYSEIGKPILIDDFLKKARLQMVSKSDFLKTNDTTSIQSSSANRLKPSPPF